MREHVERKFSQTENEWRLPALDGDLVFKDAILLEPRNLVFVFGKSIEGRMFFVETIDQADDIGDSV